MASNFKYFVKKSVNSEAKPYRVLRYALLYAKKNDMTVYDEGDNVLYTGDAVSEKLADMQRKTAEKMLKSVEETEKSLGKENVILEAPVQNIEESKNKNIFNEEVIGNAVKESSDGDPEVEVPRELYDLIMAFESSIESEDTEGEILATDEDIDKIFEDKEPKEEKKKSPIKNFFKRIFKRK